MRNGRNYFACEEREQPFVRALAHHLALEHQQGRVPQRFRELRQPDLAGPGGQ